MGLALAYAIGAVDRGDVPFVVSLAIEILVLRLVMRLRSVGVKARLLLIAGAVGLGFGVAYLVDGLLPQDVAIATLFLVCGQKMYGF